VAQVKRLDMFFCLFAASCVGTAEAPMFAARSGDVGLVFDAGVEAPETLDAGSIDAEPRDSGGDATGAHVDAGVLDAGADAGVSLPQGFDAGGSSLVPIFVASGDGAWRASSCDLGRTWLLREESSLRADHSAWTNFAGLAAHDGVFVLATGWGEPGHMLRSTDAVGWPFVPDSNFLRPGQSPGLQASVAAVVHDGLRFVAFTDGILHSPDGLQWSKKPFSVPAGAHQVRQVRADSNTHAIAAAVETQYGTAHSLGNWITVSENGGESWREGSGFDASCAFPIQHDGDIAFHKNIILVASQHVCRSTDLGRTWSLVHGAGAPNGIRGVFTGNNAFYALTGRNVFRSDDGLNWLLVSTLPVDVERGIFGAQTYVVISSDGRRFFYSGDAIRWNEGSAPTTLSAVRIRDVAFTYGAHASECKK
jgi:hypothetical protein